MNIGYMAYQAERPMSRAEQRAADNQRGELAAALSRRLRRKRAASPASAVAPAAPATALAAVPDCACELCFPGGHEPAPQTPGRRRDAVSPATPLAPEEHSPLPGEEADFQPAHW
jgi:hypothetical protein